MATAGPPPNYYAILEIAENASTAQVRDAYKRAALKTHPDRVAADSPERAQRTRSFQLVNDAYYTLSDPARRREYDAQRRMFGYAGSHSAPGSMPGAFDDAGADTNGGGGGSGANFTSWAWNFFTNNNQQGRQNQSQSGTAPDAPSDRQRTEDAQFADVFEEMLREEGMADPSGSGAPTSKFWSLLGGLSGGALGFIVANVPGLLAGAVAGNRLGAVRDARGKSVYAVFQELPQADRARMLSQLAAKVFSHAVGI